MTLLAIDASNEWKYFGNTEAVTFFRKTGDGQYDSGTAVANALALEIGKDQPAGSRGAKVKAKLPWLLWASQAGATPAKVGDVIQDASGTRWAVFEAEIQAWGARYFVHTLREG